MVGLDATLVERFPRQPCPAFDDNEDADPVVDLRWFADLPPGCGLLRRSSGIMAMAVAAVENGALTLLLLMPLLTPRLVVAAVALVVALVLVGSRRGCSRCWWCV